MHEWQAASVFRVTNRSSPQCTHTNHRLVTHTQWRNNKCQTQAPPTTYSALKLVLQPPFMCKRYCIHCCVFLCKAITPKPHKHPLHRFHTEDPQRQQFYTRTAQHQRPPHMKWCLLGKLSSGSGLQHEKIIFIVKAQIKYITIELMLSSWTGCITIIDTFINIKVGFIAVCSFFYFYIF